MLPYTYSLNTKEKVNGKDMLFSKDQNGSPEWFFNVTEAKEFLDENCLSGYFYPRAMMYEEDFYMPVITLKQYQDYLSEGRIIPDWEKWKLF